MLQSETVRKYDTYKDSGIEWLGEIPQVWKYAKLAWCSNFVNGYAFNSENMDIDGEVPVVRIGDIQNGKVIYDTCLKVNNNNDLDQYELKKDDIVMAMSGATTGKLAVVDSDDKAYINQRVGIIRSKNNKFIRYCLDNDCFLQYVGLLSAGSAQPNISMGNILDYKIPYISYDEQQKIADYLDKKCGEIDRVIETEKLVIEKLKEYKQSIITEAVTKGLDKSVPLKDSGIEWIGKIPQHWEIIKLKKTISLIADIDHYMPDTTDTGYSYLMTGDLKDIASKIDFENCKHISDSDYKDLSKKIHPVLDDVIFARYATIGTVCYVDIQKDFLVSYSCLTIRPNSEKLFGKFLYYYLISDTFKIEVSQYINSNTQSNVGLDSLQKVYMVLPNKTEQQQIAEYLDKKCSEIDKAIANKEQVIEKFTEYKKSLIYECVTGKRKVVA